ncbi:MAG TPA: hypothetical protein VGQ83_36335 [Polyangia bacterium]|jgi:hypothetical protein
MFRLLRFLFWTTVLFGFLYVALAVPLGKRTLAGHLVNLWRSPEGQELREGTKEAAGPVIDKMKRGARELMSDGGAPPAAPRGAGSTAPRK